MNSSPDHLRLVDVTSLEAANVRPLPQSIEAEQFVLGAILINNESFPIARAKLQAEHFSDPLHQAIFDAAERMINEGKLVSVATLRVVLPEIQGEFTIAEYLSRLAVNAIEGRALSYVAQYSLMVLDLAQRREMIAIANELSEQSYDAPIEASSAKVAYAIIEDLQQLAAKAAPTSTRRIIGDAAMRLIEHAEAVRRGEVINRSVSTGFPAIDRLTGGGYQPQKLWILAGRPGSGKTVYMTSSSRHVAAKGHGCLAFSMEVAEDEIIARHLADLVYSKRRPIDFQRIQTGSTLDDEDVWCLCDAQRRLKTMPLVLDVASRLTTIEIAARVRAEKRRMEAKGHPLRVVFIDYLNFISASDRYKGQRVNEVGEISLALKQLAKDEEICIVLLAQLNRQIEARDDKRPQLSDLRDSGNLEQDADVVALLYREHYYLIKRPEYRRGEEAAVASADAVRNDCEVILGKNRAGAEKAVQLWCEVASSTMADMAHGDIF
jgi:replicative DNA helicase